MMETFIQNVEKLWAESYYTELVVIATAIFSLMKLAKRPKSFELRKVFMVYCASVIFLFVGNTALLAGLSDQQTKFKLLEVFNCLFNIVEAFTVFSFYLSILNSSNSKKHFSFLFMMTVVINLAGITLIGFKDFTTHEYFKIGDMLCVINLLILLFPSLKYFLKVYDETTPFIPKTAILALEIFGYCLISLPFMVIAENLRLEYIRAEQWLFILHFFTLIILCLGFSFYHPLDHAKSIAPTEAPSFN
jgi:hypothetical protein